MISSANRNVLARHVPIRKTLVAGSMSTGAVEDGIADSLAYLRHTTASFQ